jgi:hypothetical protein
VTSLEFDTSSTTPHAGRGLRSLLRGSGETTEAPVDLIPGERLPGSGEPVARPYRSRTLFDMRGKVTRLDGTVQTSRKEPTMKLRRHSEPTDALEAAIQEETQRIQPAVMPHTTAASFASLSGQSVESPRLSRMAQYFTSWSRASCCRRCARRSSRKHRP